jgi:hypothetical protein
LTSELWHSTLHYRKGGISTVRSTGQRVIAITTIAVLNAAWFFTIGCAALCAFSSCPRQAPQRRASEEQCDHKSELPQPQRDNSSHRSSCPDRNYFVAGVARQAAPDATSGLRTGSNPVGVVEFHSRLTPRRMPLPNTLSHSPPGLSAGRALLQRESLLRI